MELDDLLPLHFAALGRSRELVAVRAADPFALKTAGDERLNRILPGDLDPDELDLFSQPPGELSLVNDAGAAGLKVSLQNRKPSYAAAVAVEACLGNETLQENYRIRLHAAGGDEDRSRRGAAGATTRSPRCTGRWTTTTSRP